MASLIDTISAIATPIGAGGVGIVRISGENATDVLQKVFVCKTPVKKMQDRKMYLGEFLSNQFSDKCLAVVFKAPNSYTGEDVVELQCHGGRALILEVLRTVLQNGARLAENGEFTKRAFINGKISLSGAEGVIEMINSESTAELNASYSLASEKLNNFAVNFQNQITDIISRIEVVLDYPDEEVELEDLKENLRSVLTPMQNLKKSYATGKMLKQGINVAVVGRTNVGKSSLMNTLLNYERAIVTEIEGTTRDTVEAVFTVDGVKFNLIDTAGIRKSVDFVENIGIEKSKKMIKLADVVLFVFDSSVGLNCEDKEILNLTHGKPLIVVANKIDKSKLCDKEVLKMIESCGCKNAEIQLVSAKDSTNIENLKEKLVQLFAKDNVAEGGVVLTNERHFGAICRAIDKIEHIFESVDEGVMLDYVAMELKLLWDILGEITGTTATEEIINNIFAKFCLGK